MDNLHATIPLPDARHLTRLPVASDEDLQESEMTTIKEMVFCSYCKKLFKEGDKVCYININGKQYALHQDATTQGMIPCLKMWTAQLDI